MNLRALKRTSRRQLKTILAAAIFLLAGHSIAGQAAEHTVQVLDRNGDPVPNVFVLVDQPAASEDDTVYVMDQVNLAFDPSVLFIPVGGQVSFPNSDPVAHHVYSFSKPNNFVLPLYKGQLPSPITFQHEGVVVLGCNIHDHMVGHIVVSHRAVKGQTDDAGLLTFSDSELTSQPAKQVQIWSPRIRVREALVKTLSEDGKTTFQLTKRLKPPLKRPKFEDY